MRNNLLQFLFGQQAAVTESSSNLGDEVVRLFEEAAQEETEQMVANKKPLASALKDIGIDCEVHEKAQWCEIHCADEKEHREHMALLTDPDAMHKLAELGWIVANCGDAAMGNEPADCKIGFIEIANMEPSEDETGEPLEKVLKDAQKFATTPVDRDDSMNPVETDIKGSASKQKGVGKPTDGTKPKGEIKDSVGARRVVNRLLDEMTSCSAIPAVEQPMMPPIGAQTNSPDRSRFKKKQLKKPGQDERTSLS